MNGFVRALAALVVLINGVAAAEDEDPMEFGKRARVSLPAGEVVNRDYFAAGRVIEIFGTVNGDVYAAGGQVIINGQINGDLLAAGGAVSISGNVEQDVRVAGGQITIGGDIGRNLTVAGGNVELTDSARIRGGLVAAGGAVGLAAPVGKDAKIAAGNATLSNAISGNLTAAAGELRLTSRAAVAGDVTYWSRNEASIDSSARVGGVLRRKTMPEMPAPGAMLWGFAGLILFVKLVNFVSTLILGMLCIALAPGSTQSVVLTLRARPWASLGVGFIALVTVPAAAGVLAATVLGIPLALMITALYLIAIYVARIFAILWAGSAWSVRRGRPVRPGWALVMGLVVYSVVTLIPFVGGFVTLAAILFGLGAALLGAWSVLPARSQEGSA
ncbi:MAG: hypothetical protein AB1515_05735 [Nitrospirota bacterium]